MQRLSTVSPHNPNPGWQDGNTVVVCTCATVSSMGTGVLGGLLALGERMPAAPAARALRLASWLCITLGVAGLANGSGARRRHRLPHSLPGHRRRALCFLSPHVCRAGPRVLEQP